MAERGIPARHLMATVAAALAFDVPEDPESVELQELVGSLPAPQAVEKVTGLTPDHPLYPEVLDAFEQRSHRKI